MSDMLSIGASSLKAYQAALTTSSENIANAGNAGYSRRVTTVREVVAQGGVNSNQTAGMGVVAGGVHRAIDVYRTAEVRTATADLAKTEAGVTWMGRIENALTGSKLGDRVTAFFTSAKAVAADPGSLAPRAAMLESASSVAAAFAGTGAALDGAAESLDSSAEAGVLELNTLAQSLARVNGGLGRSQPGTSGTAALLDERDRLLQEMSAITDVSVKFDSFGRATLRTGDGAGPLLVQGDTAGIVTYVRDKGNVSFALHMGGETSAVFPNGGALAGVVEGAQRIADAKAEVDTMARNFAEGVNAIQKSGQDLNAATGADMFTIGDPASRLTLAITDPRGIAASGANAGVRDNSNLLKLETLRSGGKFEEGVATLTSSNAAALSARRSVAEAQGAIHASAVAERTAITGVNIDEEAVDLIRFQQAYQASSRVIQVARDTLQSILDIR